MKKYEIKKGKFLDWYFRSGSDDENEELKMDLASSVIEAFEEGRNFTIQDLFDNVNHDLIPLKYIEGFASSVENLLGYYDYHLELVD